jgi:hypothetical protein
MEQIIKARKFNANCPQQRRPAWELLEVKQTRFLRGGAAVHDPKRRLGTVKYRTTNSASDHLVDVCKQRSGQVEAERLVGLASRVWFGDRALGRQFKLAGLRWRAAPHPCQRRNSRRELRRV